MQGKLLINGINTTVGFFSNWSSSLTELLNLKNQTLMGICMISLKRSYYFIEKMSRNA